MLTPRSASKTKEKRSGLRRKKGSKLTEISVFDVLNIGPDEIENYSIRLNGSLGDWNIATAYHSDRHRLLEHAHKVQWSGHTRRNIHTRNVLQFIQLTPRSTSEWLFIGATTLSGTERTNDGGDRVTDFSLQEKYEAFAGRLVVRYTRRQGVMGPGALTHNLSKPEISRDFATRMVVDRIAQSAISALPFPGFEATRLSHPQLVSAVNNSEWKGALDSVSAVYLITDKSNGWHYVGSAYSRRGSSYGLLSRWSEYAAGDFTGGNTKLKELVELNGKQYIEGNFEYSILEIFDRRATSTDIIKREHWWMDTLGSVWRTDSPFGYNTQRERDESGVEIDKN